MAAKRLIPSWRGFCCRFFLLVLSLCNNSSGAEANSTVIPSKLTVPTFCKDVMDAFCNNSSCVGIMKRWHNTTDALHGRFDTDSNQSGFRWRCYASTAMDETMSRYDETAAIDDAAHCSVHDVAMTQTASDCLQDNLHGPEFQDLQTVHRDYTGVYQLQPGTLTYPCGTVCLLQPDLCMCNCLQRVQLGPAQIDRAGNVHVTFLSRTSQASCCPAIDAFELGRSILVSLGGTTRVVVRLDRPDFETIDPEIKLEYAGSVHTCYGRFDKVTQELDDPHDSSTGKPGLSTPASEATSINGNNSSNVWQRNEVIGGVAAGAFGLIAFVCVLVIVAALRRRSRRRTKPISDDVTIQGMFGFGSELAREAARQLALERTSLALGAIIGQGAFGEVREGFYQGSRVAVKSIRDTARETDVADFQAEAMTLAELHCIGSHPHIIKVLGLDLRQTPWLIVMEYMTMGSLLSVLRSADPNSSSGSAMTLSNEDMLSILHQCASGLAFLHKHKYLHRDIAARNVLVDSGLLCKLADFGFARDVYKSAVYLKTSATRVPFKWMAPESLQRNIYTTATDVWSYGVLAWEVFSFGCMPFASVDNAEILDHILEGNRLQLPEDLYPTTIAELIQLCWKDCPDDRPSAQEVVDGLHKAQALLKNEPRKSDRTSPLLAERHDREGPHAYVDLISAPTLSETEFGAPRSADA